MDAELLAIVEVEEDQKVRCHECGHGVYKSVHVIGDSTRLWVLGSTCSERLFGFTPANAVPRFGAGSTRKLTEEERSWLNSNTEKLLDQFRSDEAVAEEARQLRSQDEQARAARSVRPTAMPSYPIEDLEEGDRPWTVDDGERAAKSWRPARRTEHGFTTDELNAAMAEVRSDMRARGVRAELIERETFVGAQAEALLRRRRGS